MDLNRLRALLAAPLASLFLVLSLCAFVVQRPPSVGIRVPITKIRTAPYNVCPYVDRSIVVRLLKDGSYWINETLVPANELRPRLADIYENRAEKILPVYSDPDVTYGLFGDFYSEVESSTSNLHIILRTRGLEAQLQRCPAGMSCGLDWPGIDYTPCSLPELLPPIPIHVSGGAPR
jgi:biopolymer transport protein ExbD